MVKLTAISRFVYELTNISLPVNKPFVGENAFAHKGGIHASAVRQKEKTYERLDP